MFGSSKTVLVLAIAGYLFAATGSAFAGEAGHVVATKRDEVKLDAKADDSDGERVVADAGQDIGDKRKIEKLFVPPSKWVFEKFREVVVNPFKLDYVDIIVDPDDSQASAAPEGPSKIKVVATVPKAKVTAGSFPVKCEGNIVRKPGGGHRGGGGTGGGGAREYHWAAMIGDLVVDLDVDTDRDGDVDKDDEENEDTPVDYLKPTGALVLVNCDNDGKRAPKPPAGARDMDDKRINGLKDYEDLSDLVLTVSPKVPDGHKVFLVVANPNGASSEKPNDKIRIIDDKGTQKNNADDVVVIGPSTGAEVEVTALFSGNTKSVTLKMEGLQFGEQLVLKLECRKGNAVVQSDTVATLNTPALLIPNTQPLVSQKTMAQFNYSDWGKDNRGFKASLTAALKAAKIQGTARSVSIAAFVQDALEVGFQRRLGKAQKQDLTMLVVLRLGRPQTWTEKLLAPDIGMYAPPTTGASGDDGGAVDALPPFKGAPYGQVVVSNSTSEGLRGFFSKQKVQALGGKLMVANPGSFALRHADEVMCVVPKGDSFVVLVPDVRAAIDELKRVPANAKLPRMWFAQLEYDTYGQLVSAFTAKNGAKIKAVEKAVNALKSRLPKGTEVVGVPVIIDPDMGAGRAVLSKNFMNTQVAVTGGKTHLFVSVPHTRRLRTLVNGILSKLGTVHWVDTDRLKQVGGETHCATKCARTALGRFVKEEVK